MKTRALMWLFAGAMVAAGCSKESSGPSNQGPPTTPPPGTTNVQVSMGESTFNPSSVQLPIGGSVTWRNATATQHTITPQGFEQPGSWGAVSVPAQTGFTFTHTFNSAGTFNYVCNLHAGMTGTVRVL
jgi:plastocyanin